MKFCTHCGKEMMNDAVVCTNCGCAVNGVSSTKGAVTGDDIPNGGLNAVAFFIPLVGFVLYCIMQGRTPRKANQIGVFALVGFLINIVIYVALLM